MGCQKLGQPVPDSNLVLESKRTVLQQMQVYRPSAWLLAYLPVKGTSVPAWRVTSNCSGVNCFFHSAGGFSTLSTSITPVRTPKASNWTIRTFLGAAKAEEALKAAAAERPAPIRFINARRCNLDELKPIITCLPSSPAPETPCENSPPWECRKRRRNSCSCTGGYFAGSAGCMPPRCASVHRWYKRSPSGTGFLHPDPGDLIAWDRELLKNRPSEVDRR